MNAPSARMRYRIKGTDRYVQPAKAKANSTFEAASQAPRLVRWNPSSAGPNTSLRSSYQTLVRRSRDAVRQNSLASRGKEILVSNIVGTGIKPNFGTKDRDFNALCAEAFAEWTDEADADARCDFYGLQAIAVAEMIEGGDSFTRLRVRLPEDGLSVPLQLQVLESEFCPIFLNETAANGNVINQGIEIDLIGRRVAYWLYQQHPLDLFLMPSGYNALPLRVPGTEIVHLARVHDARSGQLRGAPWLARALVKLYDIDQYDDAQVIRQKIAALFAGFVSEDLPEDAKESGKLFEGETAPDTDGVALASLEPGTMQVLPAGKSIDFSTPPDAGPTYDVFMRHQQRTIAAGMGVLYEQLTGDYGNLNDRTWRAAVNEFRRLCESIQHQVVVFQFCRPVMQRWAALAVLSGRLKPPKGMTADTIARSVDWRPARWPYINPVQDVQATKDEIRSGLTSRKRAVAEDGYDVEELDVEIAADNARADDLGLVFDTDPRRVANTGKTQGQPVTGDEFIDPGTPPGGHPDPNAANAANAAAMLDGIGKAIASMPQPVVNVTVPITVPKKGVEVTTVTKHDARGRIETFERREREE